VLDKIENVTTPIASATVPDLFRDVDGKSISPTALGAWSNQLPTLSPQSDASARKLILNGHGFSYFDRIVCDVPCQGYIEIKH